MLRIKLIFISSLLCYHITITYAEYVNSEQYCEGCQAVIKEMHKKMTAPSFKSYGAETAVITIMDEICASENFRSYAYIPPEMVKICNYIKDQYDEILEEELTKYYSKPNARSSDISEETIHYFCNNVTTACQKANMEKVGREKQQATLMMDGVKKKADIGPGGRVDL